MKIIKSLSLLVVFGFISLSGFSQIDFFSGRLSHALEEAKKENKIVFVDAYTTWCGPCKWMAAKVFTDPEVGEFFNENFVNLKVNCETTDGRAFQYKYKVRAYPTLLFLKPNGEVVLRELGGKKPKDFIEIAKRALKN